MNSANTFDAPDRSEDVVRKATSRVTPAHVPNDEGNYRSKKAPLLREFLPNIFTPPVDITGYFLMEKKP
jgi:hypothetical protein